MNNNVMPWFTPSEWSKIRALCDDPDAMGASYDVWLDAAKKTAQLSESNGATVHKVYLVSDRFLTWAKRNRRRLKSEDRVAYALDLFVGAAS